MNVENRVVIVTGATGGLGRIATKLFADQGTRLVLVGTHLEKLEHLIEELSLPRERILLHAADLSRPEAAHTLAQETLERFGQIYILLHLVGGWSGGSPVTEVEDEQVESMLQQHLWTTYHLAQAIIPAMVASRWGRILVISSPIASHGDTLLNGQMDTSRLSRIILTALVPYLVSTVSSASSILSMRKG